MGGSGAISDKHRLLFTPLPSPRLPHWDTLESACGQRVPLQPTSNGHPNVAPDTSVATGWGNQSTFRNKAPADSGRSCELPGVDSKVANTQPGATPRPAIGNQGKTPFAHRCREEDNSIALGPLNPNRPETERAGGRGRRGQTCTWRATAGHGGPLPLWPYHTQGQGHRGQQRPIRMHWPGPQVQRLQGAVSTSAENHLRASQLPPPPHTHSPVTALLGSPTPEVPTQTAATCHPSHTCSGLQATATDSPFLSTKLSLPETFGDLLLPCRCLQLHHLDKTSVSRFLSSQRPPSPAAAPKITRNPGSCKSRPQRRASLL